MSRELLVLAAIATFCIILTPVYNEMRNRNMIPLTISKAKPRPSILLDSITSSKSDTLNPKNIILLTYQFLPTTFAGSEISAYETIKYLRSRGHNIKIYVNTFKVSSYDRFPIYKYDPDNIHCRNDMLNADIILYQFGKNAEDFKLIQERRKPVYIVVHLLNYCEWVLTHKTTFPTCVVYNSRFTQEYLPTIHDNMRMIPYVDTREFNGLRNITIKNNVVCLINCNKNKGSSQMYDMAEKLPNVQFLAVKGAYAQQDIKDPAPKNVTYMDNQDDIKVVLKKVGILIMPSQKETWGRTAVEAMASGIPVIHSEAGGLVECVGGAGIMCQRDDIDAWCQAIRRIIGDKVYRERLRKNGFLRIEEIEREQIRGRRELAHKIEE